MSRALAGLLAMAVIGAGYTYPADELKIGGAVIHVVYSPGAIDLPPAMIHKWMSDAVEAVTVYFGRFPVREVRLSVNPAEGRSGVSHGTTWGRDFGAFIRISVGQQTKGAELANDWMMTHELIHTGFPSVADEHHWIEEGLATYVEPIARVQAGQMDATRMWSDLVRDMPQGEPEAGDQGLDRTHTWGRTYWGGALFLFVADVKIHERTGNRKGLQDALRAIVAAGGTIQHEWPLEKALQTGDRATGTTVLTDLYAEMKAAPVRVDLPALWKRLGIESHGRGVIFHDDAPLAAIRFAITAKMKD